MKVVIFGIGNGMQKFMQKITDDIEVVCYVDNYNKINEINGKKVIQPNELKEYIYDYIIICSQYYKEIVKQLKLIGIKEENILSYFYYLEDKLYYENKNEVISKYIQKRGLALQRNERLDYSEKKQQYNNYYTQKIDKWSETNDEKCKEIVGYLLKNIKPTYNYLPEERRVLDVGCAKGGFCNAFQECGFSSTGIDCSEVAIDIAKNKYNKCEFRVMDGFNPTFKNEKFSIIFMRGFSGCNTHNIEFVKEFINKYCKLLIDRGIFIVAYSSDFSGKEIDNETVNWTSEEIEKVVSGIPCELVDILYPDCKTNNMLLTYKEKIYYYLVLKKYTVDL